MRSSISALKNNRINNLHRQKIMVHRKTDSMHIAKSEISKIIIGLNLFAFEDFKKIILEKYAMISEKLRRTTKYRDPRLLIPLIIYTYLRLNDHKISKSQLLSVSHISSADFNDFIMQLKNYLSRMIK